MKRVKDSQNDLALIGLVFCFIVYFSVRNHFIVSGYFFSFALFILFVMRFVPKHYNFEYNTERIVVRNSWNPFFTESII